MFYAETVGELLRMGDIVHGYVLGSTQQKEPTTKHIDYSINLKLPDFAVVCTPCCSIGDKTIALAPLLPIIQSWLENEYWMEDLTRINYKMQPDKAISKKHWETLSDDMKKERFAGGEAYALGEWFVFSPNPLLPKYKLRKKQGPEIETDYYAVDFRKIYRVECNQLINNRSYQPESKLLELSIDARQAFRDKISCYFGRIPQEDKQ